MADTVQAEERVEDPWVRRCVICGRRISGQHVKGHWWYCRVCEREWAIPRYRVSNPVFNTDPEKGALGRLHWLRHLINDASAAWERQKRDSGKEASLDPDVLPNEQDALQADAWREVANNPGGATADDYRMLGVQKTGGGVFARVRGGRMAVDPRWYPPRSASCARAWYYHHPEWADFLLRWEPYGPAREHRRYRLANGRRRLYRWVAFPDGRHTPYLAPCAYGHIPTGAALGAAASNAAYRKANGVYPASIPVAEPPMTTLEEAQEAAARLQRLQAAAGLTEREERIVHLSLNGYQFAEIAAELEAHPASISRSWHNALRKLQEAEARQSQELTQQEAA